MKTLNPPGWPTPKGYSNGISASGRFVFVAGQVGARPDMTFESDDFAVQFRRALQNTVDVLATGGAKPEHVARMTIYVTDKRLYCAKTREIGRIWRENLGKWYPAMTLLEVSALVEDRALVEIESTAIIPDAAA